MAEALEEPAVREKKQVKKYLGVNVFEAALERMRLVYDTYDNVVVSFSGGKDSTAVLHVALIVAEEKGRLPVKARFVDEEGIAYETEDYVRRVFNRPDVDLTWYCVPVKHRNATSSESNEWQTWSTYDQDLWVRPMPSEATTVDQCPWYPEPYEHGLSVPQFLDTEAAWRFTNGQWPGRTAIIMGIRAQESLVRMAAISTDREDNFILPAIATADKVYPIYDWTVEDVWTAPHTMGWDYNEAYDLMEMYGFTHGGQRVAPPFGNEPMQMLHMWQSCFPEIWDRLCVRVPGAQTGARYSKTELYAFGEMPQKPADMTWPEFIRSRLGMVGDEKDRGQRALKIQEMVRKHRKAAKGAPILYTEHPVSGIGWRMILKVAERGDPKGRVLASLKYGNYKRYNAELAQYNAAREKGPAHDPR